MSTTLEKARARLAAYRKDKAKAEADRADADKRLTLAKRLIANVKKVIKRNSPPRVPKNVGGWHPDATRVPYQGAGAFVTASAKIVWHTTEGSSLPTYSGSAPHFTLDPRSGKLWQHTPITQAARSLEHPPGTVETNRAHAYQVELIGFAQGTQDWPADAYANIAKLARWIEHHGKVPRTCGVTFSRTPHRLSDSTWLMYAGHLGHQHVPNNHHWDPGSLRIDLILK